MPKSKRDKKISLTKTSKKGLTLKQHIIEDVRTCVEKYSTIVLFSVHNMRNNTLKEIRGKWTGSRFFFGKNKIIALALGKSAETEIADGISKLASKLSGQCGLFFTNENQTNVRLSCPLPIDVLQWMRDYEQTDYARSGFRTSVTIELPAGPLEDFPHSIEPHLRQLGMPTSLQKGVVTLVKDYTICTNGQTLTPEQASILKLLGHSLAKFMLTPLGVFTKTTGYKNIAENNETKENDENIMEE